MGTSADPATLLRALEVFEEIRAREIREFGARRLQAMASGRIDWMLADLCERMGKLAAKSDADAEVLALVNQLIEEHWAKLFHLATLNAFQPH